MRVGVAAVPSRVAAPGGTSGAGDGHLLARAAGVSPPHGLHGDAVAPRPVEPAERPGRGAAWRGDARRPGGGGTSWGLRMEQSAASVPAALPYYVAFSQLLGLTVVAVTGAWLGLYRGGIAWESSLQFNVHPLCMVMGMIFLQGDALLVYRVFRKEAKRTTKILHGLLHIFAFIIALVGLVAVFDYHKKKGYADLYSLHSWCGISVFVLYFMQWLVGFSFFLFPGASFSLRSRYRPQHTFFGATIFLLSVGTALLGLKEALLFKLGSKYSTFEPEGVLANVLGLLLICFGVVVLYILAQADWKRPTQAEEQALSMDFKTLTEGDSPSPQ